MHLAIKMFLAKDDDYVLGPGQLELLRLIRDLGSLRKAAGELGVSYRWAWGRLNKTEEAIGVRLLARGGEAFAGRSMSLTPEGRAVLDWFEAVEKSLHRVVRKAGDSMPDFLSRVSPDVQT